MVATVTMTTFICSGDFISHILRYGRILFMTGPDYVGVFVLGLVAWLGLRGGRMVTGFLVLLNTCVFLGYALSVVEWCIWNFLPVADWPGFVRGSGLYGGPLYEDRHYAALIIAFNLCAAFSLWVLLLSKDARFYRRTRRREVVTEEANAFEWPPEYRRQGRSDHAS